MSRRSSSAICWGFSRGFEPGRRARSVLGALAIRVRLGPTGGRQSTRQLLSFGSTTCRDQILGLSSPTPSHAQECSSISGTLQLIDRAAHTMRYPDLQAPFGRSKRKNALNRYPAFAALRMMVDERSLERVIAPATDFRLVERMETS